MICCIPVTDDGRVGGGWGRAHRVAVATVVDGAVLAWDELDVGWDTAHDEGTEGSHHARVARFVREQHIELVVANHMGPPMENMLTKLGIRTVQGADGDARAAVVAAAAG